MIKFIEYIDKEYHPIPDENHNSLDVSIRIDTITSFCSTREEPCEHEATKVLIGNDSYTLCMPYEKFKELYYSALEEMHSETPYFVGNSELQERLERLEQILGEWGLIC